MRGKLRFPLRARARRVGPSDCMGALNGRSRGACCHREVGRIRAPALPPFGWDVLGFLSPRDSRRYSCTMGSAGVNPAYTPCLLECFLMRFAGDVTACWRPLRVGMTTVAIELSKALVAHKGKDHITLLCSRERPRELEGLECEAVLSPYRHELNLKTRWLPALEPRLECDANLYPYLPSPPVWRHAPPPAPVFLPHLAFRLRPPEGPWPHRCHPGTALRPAPPGS